jgi:hypothetical protein
MRGPLADEPLDIVRRAKIGGEAQHLQRFTAEGVAANGAHAEPRGINVWAEDRRIEAGDRLRNLGIHRELRPASATGTPSSTNSKTTKSGLISRFLSVLRFKSDYSGGRGIAKP